MKKTLILLLCCFVCLAGCATPSPEGRTCSLVLEKNDRYTCDRYHCTVPLGEDARFVLRPAPGYVITGAQGGNWVLEENSDGTVTLILEGVRYSRVITLTTGAVGRCIIYDGNGGADENGGTVLALPTGTDRARPNTALGTDVFYREGYALVGWNTASDGSGEGVGLGSRVTWEENLTLYAQWVPQTEEAAFTWERVGDVAAITGYAGSHDTLCIPRTLGGLPVQIIRSYAFQGAPCRRLILPPTLKTLEDWAFSHCALEELWLFDSLDTVSGHVFSGCDALATLHLNAGEAPVYAGTYYATFPDKYDRLLSLADQKKLVLFSGSSTRFGYDSAQLAAAFPDYGVVNMGVFAYTNAVPQLELILEALAPGDILLHSPEFDAARRQFCTTDKLDAPFFNMIEGNYDILCKLDLRDYTQVFQALGDYLASREGMTPGAYSLDPGDFDEDGNPADSPSYNEYGDYILYRPNADDEAPIYGLAVDYTRAAFPKHQFLDPLNAMIGKFREAGVRVYLTYSPRNRLAISGESTAAERAALDDYFREHLDAPILGTLEESLWSGIYLYGTDNHLSTEGVEIRTRRIIALLTDRLEQEEPS